MLPAAGNMLSKICIPPVSKKIIFAYVFIPLAFRISTRFISATQAIDVSAYKYSSS